MQMKLLSRWAVLLLTFVSACDSGRESVVVYTSVDDIFARPILAAFERETGIDVLEVFDVEAQKTTGLFQRLLAEKERPRADVFWNSEFARTLQLEWAGVLAPFRANAADGIPAAYLSSEGFWSGFGLRARVIIYHRDLVSAADRPTSIQDLASPRFRGKAGIAQPLFGTTATHAGALWERLGETGAQGYFRALVANDVHVLAGNSTVRDRVVSGELEIGLTDTDDAHVALRKGVPIGIVFPDQTPGFPGLTEPLGTFVIPNTVSLVRGGPHPENGKRFIEFLVSAQTEQALAAGDSAQIPVRAGIERPPNLAVPSELVIMEVSYVQAARGVEAMTDFLRDLFVR